MSLQVLNGPIIAAGESLSEGIDCTAGEIVRLTMPAGWTSAPISFQFSTDGEGYNDLYHLTGQAGNVFSYEVVLNNVEEGVGVVVPPEFGRGIAFLKIRSGTRSQPIVQDQQRDFAVAILTRP